MYVCVYVCVCVCVCVLVCVCIYAYMHTKICIHTHTHTHTHSRLRIHTHTHKLIKHTKTHKPKQLDITQANNKRIHTKNTKIRTKQCIQLFSIPLFLPFQNHRNTHKTMHNAHNFYLPFAIREWETLVLGSPAHLSLEFLNWEKKRNDPCTPSSCTPSARPSLFGCK